jgi:betaine-aldehyde dehydrogenase
MASPALERFARVSGRHWVGGELVAARGSESVDLTDPATEGRIGHFVSASDSEVDAAVAAANAAQIKWRKVNALTRAELLHEAARRMREARPVVAEMLTREMGKPFKESTDEVNWSVLALDYYAEVGRHDNGRVLGPTVDGQAHLVTKDPLGVVVLVLPYNYPLCLLCWQAAAALASGNACIIKPSELTTLTTLEFCQAFKALPVGLVQVLAGTGRVGQRLVEHPETHMVAFTGGIETGRHVAESCARQYKRSLIETSGNDPFIVMPSAPLDVAARGAAFGAFLNCGQVCAASERFYVHRKVYREFSQLLIGEARKLRVGNGLGRVDLGPMASAGQRDRYETILKRAVTAGCSVGTGGGRPKGLNKGWFVEPTVLVDVAADQAILNDESFGPVAPLCPVDSFEEAIALANRSRYALGSTIYTRDLDESMRAINEIEAGMVWVNAPLLDNNAGPFGGRKHSGMGRQLGSEGLDTFRHTKFSIIDPAAQPHDFWWFPYQDAEAYSDPPGA